MFFAGAVRRSVVPLDLGNEKCNSASHQLSALAHGDQSDAWLQGLPVKTCAVIFHLQFELGR